MPTMLVILKSPDELTVVQSTGVEVLARYPHSLLVSTTEEQRDELARRDIETVPLPEQPVRTTGNAFDFHDALTAEVRAPTESAPGRRGYFLVRLIGPPAARWLSWLRDNDVEIFDSVEDFTLLVGTSPQNLDAVRAQDWVRDVTPYRAAMRVSPRVRGTRRRDLDSDLLAEPTAGGAPAEQRVEIALFPGEAAAPLAAAVTASGGTVLSEVNAATGTSVIAVVPAEAIMSVAALSGVRSIEPHAIPQMHNDRARTVLGVPDGNVFGATTLAGGGQLVAIADSGLDSGDPATVHPDVRGRVAGVTSWPTRPFYDRFMKNPPGHDDGPADAQSGHGTHVTGSVLGNGSAARAAGADAVPMGVAPEARVFFQAIGQNVDWKTEEQLAAEGLRPFDRPWPPEPHGLYGLPEDLRPLFAQAFDAGARIHTNSWGAPEDGAYTTNSQIVDQFVWEHPDLFILFSAGNAGVDAGGNGVIDPDSIGAPATAKNCLTVGASENVRPAGSQPKPGRDKRWNAATDENGNLRWPALGAAGHMSDRADGMAAFSSRGPADDQRIKPDVVAPGTNVLSMLSTKIPPESIRLWGPVAEGDPLRPSYCWSGGTSMSTPLVAGAAAVVRQYLLDVRDHKPSAALLKALLVNGAAPMAGQFPGEVPPGPNNVTGFGRVDLKRTLADPAFADAPDDAVSTGELRAYRIENVRPGARLRVSLVWTDAPAGSGGGLVNQLYLRVLDPTGRILDGDVTPFPDPVNNVQQIEIAQALPGQYIVGVFGFSVIVHAVGVPPGPGPRQSFALAVANGSSLTRVQ
jgi:serine protease AprX